MAENRTVGVTRGRPAWPGLSATQTRVFFRWTPSRWPCPPCRVAPGIIRAHFSRTPSAGAAAAALRGAADATPRWPASPPRRAGSATRAGKPSGPVGWYPGTPEGRRGREELIGFLPSCATASAAGRAVPPASQSRRPPPSPNQKRKEPRAAGRSSRASKPAGPPLCDFTRFATSPGRPGPTYPGPPPRRARPPALPALPLPPGPGPCPRRRGAPVRPPVAVRAVAAARRAGTWRPPPPAAARSSPAPGPAERRALPAARCCAS